MTQAGKGEVKKHRLKANGTVADPEDFPTVAYNITPTTIQADSGVLLLRDQTIDGENDNVSQPGYLALQWNSPNAQRYGAASFGAGGDDLNDHEAAEFNKLVSPAFNTANSDPTSPVITFQADGLNFDAMIAQVTGIYRWNLDVELRMSTAQSAIPPASYEHKQAQVISNGVSEANGVDIGDTVDLCNFELYIQRRFLILQNVDFEDPDPTSSLAHADVWNKMHCGRIEFHDVHRSGWCVLTAGDTVSMWHHKAADVHINSAATVDYQVAFSLHHSAEPL